MRSVTILALCGFVAVLAAQAPLHDTQTLEAVWMEGIDDDEKSATVHKATTVDVDSSDAAAMAGEAKLMNSLLPVDAWATVPHASEWDTEALQDSSNLDHLSRMQRPALLLIDSQYQFRNYYADQMDDMVQLVEAFRARCLPIIFKLWYSPLVQRHQCNQIVPLDLLAPKTMSEANRTVKYSKYDHFYNNPHMDDLLKSWGVDTVVLAGGFTEHCIIGTAEAAFSRDYRVIVPAAAVGPHLSKTYKNTADASGQRVRSLQHEASLVVMSAAVAQIVSNASVVVERLNSSGVAGAVCPDTPVAAPAADYMRAAFPNATQWCSDTVYRSRGLDEGMGVWPLWAPKEAKNAAAGYRMATGWAAAGGA